MAGACANGVLSAYHEGMDRDQFHRISRALADPQRWAILERVAAGREVACAALCEQFPVTQATISHHVKELVSAGLVRARRRAKFVFYQLEAKVWADYLAEMRRRIPAAARRKS
jgi:ArsR family transcriptional regulator